MTSCLGAALPVDRPRLARRAADAPGRQPREPGGRRGKQSERRAGPRTEEHLTVQAPRRPRPVHRRGNARRAYARVAGRGSRDLAGGLLAQRDRFAVAPGLAGPPPLVLVPARESASVRCPPPLSSTPGQPGGSPSATVRFSRRRAPTGTAEALARERGLRAARGNRAARSALLRAARVAVDPAGWRPGRCRRLRASFHRVVTVAHPRMVTPRTAGRTPQRDGDGAGRPRHVPSRSRTMTAGGVTLDRLERREDIHRAQEATG